MGKKAAIIEDSFEEFDFSDNDSDDAPVAVKLSDAKHKYES